MRDRQQGFGSNVGRAVAASILILVATAFPALAEDYEPEYEGAPPARSAPSKKQKEKEKRRYQIADPDRVDAGLFHVGFAVGGNFYIEPSYDDSTGEPDGDYFKEFGFQAGLYFDYDYSALTENVPFALRGMVGYKRVLSSVNIFAMDGLVRYMFRVSDKATFGIGPGVSAAVWFREASDTAPFSTEEILFLPSFIVGAGFEYNPFMVDFKLVVNRFGADSTLLGMELYFGFRL